MTREQNREEYLKVFNKLLQFASELTNEELAIFQEMLDTHDYSVYEAVTQLLNERAPEYFKTDEYPPKKEV